MNISKIIDTTFNYAMTASLVVGLSKIAYHLCQSNIQCVAFNAFFKNAAGTWIPTCSQYAYVFPTAQILMGAGFLGIPLVAAFVADAVQKFRRPPQNVPVPIAQNVRVPLAPNLSAPAA